MYCKYCGAHYLEGAVVCPSCDTPTDEVEKLISHSRSSTIPPQSQRAAYCKFCGAHYEDGAIACSSCGSPTDEAEKLLAQSALSSDKKRFSGYTLAADILSLVMLGVTYVLRLLLQVKNYDLDPQTWTITTAASLPEEAKLIMSVIVGVLTIIALCLAAADKRASSRGRTDTILVSLFAGAASLGIIFLLK